MNITIAILKILVKPFIGTGIGKYQPFKFFNKLLRIFMNNIQLKQLKVKTNYGFDIILDTTKIKTSVDTLVFGGYYEKLESDIIQEISKGKENFIFIDIGANIGYYSLLVSQSMKSGRIISYEPLSITYNLLKNNISLNISKNNIGNNIETFKKGIGNINSSIDIFFDDKDLLLTSTNTNKFYNHKNKEIIEIVQLDKELKNINKIDLIKIDIEGEELNAFKGMDNILLTHKPLIIFEFAFELYNQVQKKEIFEIFLKHNYHVYEINEQQKKIIKCSTVQLEKLYSKYTNFLCIHKENVNQHVELFKRF